MSGSQLSDCVVCGRLVTPEGIVPGGRIASTGTESLRSRRSRRGRAKVASGAIDGQTHAGSYEGLDGLEPTVAADDVTTIVDMPLDNPYTLNTAEFLDDKGACRKLPVSTVR